jgi:hypothetical protein
MAGHEDESRHEAARLGAKTLGCREKPCGGNRNKEYRADERTSQDERILTGVTLPSGEGENLTITRSVARTSTFVYDKGFRYHRVRPFDKLTRMKISGFISLSLDRMTELESVLA